MASKRQDPYRHGARAARKAITNGLPRWIATGDIPLGQFIDPSTGLPLAYVSGPVELENWLELYARGFNDETLIAIKCGEVSFDFRPLLMSRPEIICAFSNAKLGTLSMENCFIESPDGIFTLEISRPKSKSKPTWISYRLKTGDVWPRFHLYEGPIEVAVGREGRVFVIQTSCLFLSHDVATTQVLNSYPV